MTPCSQSAARTRPSSPTRRPGSSFRAFGESSLDLELALWLDDPTPEPAVTSDLRFAIDRAFRDAGVTIPFPQRDLHLISGWEALAQARPESTRPPRSEPGSAPPVVPDTHVDDTSAEEKATAEQMQREKAQPATEGERRQKEIAEGTQGKDGE